jgi:hypothetical protein
MARVDVLREVKLGDVGESQLCLHWCRYRDGASVTYGYRFVWRRAMDGSIQAARGQTRIPNFACAEQLMREATKAGWANRDGAELEAAAERLRQLGCRVDLASGYVGWPHEQTQRPDKLPQEGVEDAQLIHEWTH